jgi:hypothetical protein
LETQWSRLEFWNRLPSVPGVVAPAICDAAKRGGLAVAEGRKEAAISRYLTV